MCCFKGEYVVQHLGFVHRFDVKNFTWNILVSLLDF